MPMNTDQQMKSTESLEIETADSRKAWVTPVVSESPVNEITALSFNPGGADAGMYS